MLERHTHLTVCMAALLLIGSAQAVDIRTGFEVAEGYQAGKLTPAQPNPIGDVGWGGNRWTDLGGNSADPQGFVVAAADAPQGAQYYQRLGGGNSNLALRQFPAVRAEDGDFSIRWQVRVVTDKAAPPYLNNFATIEVDDTGPGGRIMTFRYDQSGNINLGSVQNNIAKWDGTGDPLLAQARNRFMRGGLNVSWSTKKIEVFLETELGRWKSIGVYSFRETNTNLVDRIYLGVGPGGTALQGISWDDLVLTSELLTDGAATVVTLPQAQDARPADGATDVPRDTGLSWTAGEAIVAHDVYLGTTFADVNDATRTNAQGVLAGQGQAATAYDPPAPLAYGQTYYWRVDEVNQAPDHTIFKGEVWSFTVEPYAYPIQPAAATASSAEAGMGPEKTIDGSGLTGDRHGTEPSTMWLAAGAPPHWIQYEFDQVCRLHELKVWNSNQVIESLLGFGAQKVTIETSADGILWTPVADVPPFHQAPGTPDCAADTSVSLGGVDAKSVRLTIEASWGGRATTGLSEVQFSYVPVQARAPQPANGATGVSLDTDLDWRPGRAAASHQVYFGTDPNALTAATTVTNHSHSPGPLHFGTTYYWKVDEVNTVTYPGPVWNFTTQEYAVVDDFESYTDDEGNRIYETWIDGWTNNTGSVVGYLQAPFAERTIVHGGRQSLPLGYDNTKAPFYSEATRTFETPQDWTTGGADTLSLWLRGNTGPNAANAPARIYLVVEDRTGKAGTVTHPDPTITTAAVWTEWRVPWSDLTGVNLAAVKKLTLGVGDKAGPKVGGTGLLYLDDIAFGHPAATK
ncbi:MAG TPA: discoidin domain-containing protein [Phycisphaerae bacterium]|nr:discoidin domain-containing protein [Phycisphaerae bacterium]